MSTISKEYGGALFLAAKEEDNASNGYLKQVFDAVMLCSRLFKENPLYVSFLKTPDIPLKDRLAAVHDALNGRVPEYVDNFIELLTERGYIDRFSECVDEFKLLYYAENGIAEAEVVSAVPLTDGEVNALRTKLKKITGKRIELLFEIDPSVIGGLIVRVDGCVIDASVRKDLDNLRELMGKTAH